MDKKHCGDRPNTVLYIPCGPSCPLSRLYAERARPLFVEGMSPPDFYSSGKDIEVDFIGRATWEDLNAETKRMMGRKQDE